ncbi:MAG: hypothetical protein LBC58_01925 [Clostridiales Family XIII bacterium]|nr:hypothetical protein [Clostridiales Family XIII bacterium]
MDTKRTLRRSGLRALLCALISIALILSPVSFHSPILSGAPGGTGVAYADNDPVMQAEVKATSDALNITGNVISKIADMPFASYLGLLGTAFSIINMFLPSQPDPVMLKLDAMSQQLTQLQSDVKIVQEQNIDLGQQVSASDMVTILNNLDGTLKKLTFDNGVNSTYYNAYIYCNRYDANYKANPENPEKSNCTAENYCNVMQSLYATKNSAAGVASNTYVLDNYEELAKIITGTGSLWNNKNLYQVYNTYFSARKNFNTQVFDTKQNMITNVSATSDYVGAFLLRAVLYDQSLNQARVDSYKAMLKENSKDPTNNDESYYTNYLNSNLSKSAVAKANSIINDSQNNVTFINNNLLSTTKPDSFVKLYHDVTQTLSDAQKALDAEKKDVKDNARIRSYRLNATLAKDVWSCPAENYVRYFCGYQVDSWEAGEFRSNDANQQYALDHHLSTDQMNQLKNAAAARSTHITADMSNAGFVWHSSYNNQAIGFGAHADKSSGYRTIYVDFVPLNDKSMTPSNYWAIDYYGKKKSSTVYSASGYSKKASWGDPLVVATK